MNEQEGKTLYQLYIITMMMKMNRNFMFAWMHKKIWSIYAYENYREYIMAYTMSIKRFAQVEFE